MKKRDNIPFTENETKFLKMLIVAFNGIAETFNMEMELRWSPRQVGSVAGSLRKKGVLNTYSGGASLTGSTGSIYRLTPSNEKIIEGFEIKYNASNEWIDKNIDLTKLVSK